MVSRTEKENDLTCAVCDAASSGAEYGAGRRWRTAVMEFDAKKVTCEIVAWIQHWFAENGPDCNAIVGISGGKGQLCCRGAVREGSGPGAGCWGS